MTHDIRLRLSPREAASEELLRSAVASQLDIASQEINDLRVVRRSIDARQRHVMVNVTVRVAIGDTSVVSGGWIQKEFPEVASSPREVIIVGAGPAGLFAALKAIELGIRPIVLERGKDVDRRRLDLADLNRSGCVDPNSNYCFGEGGAGTFSDGKLFTRSKKRGNVEEILGLLHQHGASEDILIDSHPHIGSDRLPIIIKNIRQTILSHGGEVNFCSCVTDILLDEKRKTVDGVILADGREYRGPVVLATGHSARDVYRMLHSHGVSMTAKGLAIGVRLEHPQKLIDSIQYHSSEGRGEWLPPAEYSFVCQSGGRGVYSFCMCPGGVIVPAVSDRGQLVVNGMSASARASRHANSGMVVEVRPGDFPEFESEGNLQMLALQESLEKRFFDEAGHTINAPAQRMTDFNAGRQSKNLPPTSYLPGIHSSRLDQLLPPFISDRLREGLRMFGRRSKGFMSDEAILVGLESRTSSPVRIPRDRDSLRHIDYAGLYPVGEGAGYAGGIVSAAIDGQNAMCAVYKAFEFGEILSKKGD